MSAGPADQSRSDDVERLTRWIDSGGTWAVLARRPHWVLVSLRRCDGGEEADRFASHDEQLLAMVANEPVSDY